MERAYKGTAGGVTLLAVEADYRHREVLAAAGGRWSPTGRRWELPYTTEAWRSIYLALPGMVASDEVKSDLHREEDDLDRPLLQAPPMPLKAGIKPYRHQQAAYAEALHVFGAA